MLWIDRIHRWTGGCIGLLLAVMGLTGTLLLYEDAWLRATVPHAAESLASERISAAAERLLSDAASRPNSIIFPTDDLGVFKLQFGKGSGAYADQSGAIVLRWQSKWEQLELWLFDLHHHLWMGDTGTTIVGILAIIGLGFVITGFLLWWRTRKTFAFRVAPKSMSRLHIVRHHRDLGVVMTPLLFAQFLTGAMLALRPVAEFVLAPLPSPVSITESLAAPKLKGGPLAANFDWKATLQTVRDSYPQGELRTISIPNKPGQLIRVRVRQPFEWLPNGRTVLWFDGANGQLVKAHGAESLPLATRAYNLVYPLHASVVGGVIYKTAQTAMGITLTVLGSLAVWVFWGYRARRARQGGSHGPTLTTRAVELSVHSD
jgi:uncharacterized iron-regulated membrane protein